MGADDLVMSRVVPTLVGHVGTSPRAILGQILLGEML